MKNISIQEGSNLGQSVIADRSSHLKEGPGGLGNQIPSPNSSAIHLNSVSGVSSTNKILFKRDNQQSQLQQSGLRQHQQQQQQIAVPLKDQSKIQQSQASLSQLPQQEQVQATSIIKKVIDPLKKYPSIEVALYHSESVKIGANKQLNARPELLRRCACCKRLIEKSDLPMMTDCSELQFLGAGVPLYFYFLKLCALLTLLQLFSSGIYMIAANASGGDCVRSVTSALTTSEAFDKCFKTWITVLSLGNSLSNESKIQIQSILSAVSVVLMIIAVHYTRFVFRSTVRAHSQDREHTNASEFSILVSGIDPKMSTHNFAETIKDFFTSKVSVLKLERNLEVTNIDLVFNIGMQKTLQKQHMELQLRIAKLRALPIISDALSKTLRSLEEQVMNISGQIRQFKVSLNQRDAQFYQKFFIGKAFVSFATIKEKDLLLRQYSVPPEDKFWGMRSTLKFVDGNIIELTQAPPPTEVIWENLILEKNQRACFVFPAKQLAVTILLSLIVVLFLLVQRYLLDTSLIDLSENNTQTTLAMTLLVAFFIPIINAVLSPMFLKFATSEFHPTEGILKQESALVLVKANIIVTCAVTFFIQLIFSQEFFVGRIFNAGGLAGNQLLIIIVQCFLPSLINLLDIDGKLKDRIKKQALACSSAAQLNINQRELNKIFSKPEMNFGAGYATAITVLCQSMFYSMILPLGIAFAFAGLLVQYWIDKYILLRRRSCSNPVSATMCMAMADILEYVIFFSTVGTLAFLFYTQTLIIPYASIIAFVISGVNCLLPAGFFSGKYPEFAAASPVTDHTFDYDTAVELFPERYADYNPASQLLLSKIKDKDIEENMNVSTHKVQQKYIENNNNNINNSQNGKDEEEEEEEEKQNSKVHFQPPQPSIVKNSQVSDQNNEGQGIFSPPQASNSQRKGSIKQINPPNKLTPTGRGSVGNLQVNQQIISSSSNNNNNINNSSMTSSKGNIQNSDEGGRLSVQSGHMRQKAFEQTNMKKAEESFEDEPEFRFTTPAKHRGE